MVCEDAPCCGCCGTNIYGVYQGDRGQVDPHDEYDDTYFYGDDRWDGEEDMDEDDSTVVEDAGMEEALFGDC